MVGGDVEDLYPRSPEAPWRSRLLKWRDSAARDATFTLHRGEILGIAGLLGSGRTRLLRSLFGLESVRSGRVTTGAWTGRPSRERNGPTAWVC